MVQLTLTFAAAACLHAAQAAEQDEADILLQRQQFSEATYIPPIDGDVDAEVDAEVDVDMDADEEGEYPVIGEFHPELDEMKRLEDEVTTNSNLLQSGCSDVPQGWYDIDGSTYTCAWYSSGDRCTRYGHSYRRLGKVAKEACCACGGGSGSSSLDTSKQVKVKDYNSLTGQTRGVWGYDDAGTGANSDMQGLRVQKSGGYWPLGDIMGGGHEGRGQGPYVGDLPMFGGDVRHPLDFDWIWDDRSSGGHHDIKVWKPRAPSGFTCPVHLFMKTWHTKPTASNYVCLPNRCLTSQTLHHKIWADHGSGATYDFSAFKSPIHPAYFVGIRSHAGSTTGLYSLKRECGGVKLSSVTACAVYRGGTSHTGATYEETLEKKEGFESSSSMSLAERTFLAAQVETGATAVYGPFSASVSASVRSELEVMRSSTTSMVRTGSSTETKKITCPGPCYVYQLSMKYTMSDGTWFEQTGALHTTSEKMTNAHCR